MAVNVALYHRRGGCWAMTERGRHALERDRDHLRIGPSTLAWRGAETLSIDIDERCVPWPARLRGRLRVSADALSSTTLTIDAAGRHRWTPIAPVARIEVELDQPSLRWQGNAYLDSNRGDEPLEAAFSTWTWSRARRADGTTAIHYDVRRRDGSELALALTAHPNGSLVRAPASATTTLPRTRWGLARTARGDVTFEQTFEDGPFYARALLRGADGGHAVHESLSLDRFRRRWVQTLLPFRMPRRG